MTRKNLILSALCLLSFICSGWAQNATALKTTAKNDDRLPPEIKEKAVNFLRATAKDAATLNLPENRLAFLIATADMLWEYDETAARQAFKTAETDVRQMIVAQMQKAAAAAASEDGDFGFLSAVTSGDGGASDVQSIINLRESLVLAFGKYDGDAAYRFLIETRQPAPPATDGKEKPNYMRQASQLPTANDARENALEMRLARVVAENDPQKALEIGLKRLSAGISDELPSFAVRLYFKDKTRGAQLAQEIGKKLKTSNFAIDDLSRRVGVNLFKNAAASLQRGEKDKEMSKTPLLSESDARDLANQIGRAAVAMASAKEAPEEYEIGEIREIMPQLEKYSPASAAQLKAKFKQNKTTVEGKSYEGDEEFKKYIERAKKDEQAMQDLQKSVESAKGEFSIEGARAALSLIKNRTARLAALSQIVITFADNGKSDEARELANDARKMIAPQPKFWGQYVEHLIVARALASVEPKQSLEILENLIYQIDDLLAGVGKLAEFAVGETAVKENELRISAIPGFVGGNIFAQLGRGGGAGNVAGEFDKDIIKLAKADFDRTAALTDKFTRPEIRMMARMILIGALLPQKDAENSVPSSIEPDDEMPPAPALAAKPSI